jgi:hypothetical protein
MRGWHHSDETKAKIAAHTAGRRHTEQAKAKIAESAKGRDMSAPMKVSTELRMGVSLTVEHRAKIAAATTNRKTILCVETGEIYPSITAAAKSLGVSETSVNQAIRKGCRCKGQHYRHL